MRMHEHNFHNRKRRFHLGKHFFIFLAFLIVIGIIFFTTVYDGDITGEIIRDSSLNNSFSISSETNIPSLKIQGDYSEISLEVLPIEEITLGDKKVALEKDANSLILRDFSGEISFDEDSLNIIQGKISKAYINGVLIQEGNDKRMKISPISNIEYKSMNIKDIYLKELNFICSGKVDLEGNILKLEKERLIIKSLSGDLSISKDKLILEGLVKSLEVESDGRIISVSR